MAGRRIRPDVVDLLVDHDADASDFSCKPWRLVHADGRPFSARESFLANSATPAETQAALRLALAATARYAREAAKGRLNELLGERLRTGMEFTAAVATLPDAAQSEVAALLERAYPDGPPLGIEREDGT